VLSRLIYGARSSASSAPLLHIFMCWRLSVRESRPPGVVRTVDVFRADLQRDRPRWVAQDRSWPALAMEQPHTVWLLETMAAARDAALAQELGCRYLARADNRHARRQPEPRTAASARANWSQSSTATTRRDATS